MTIVQTQLSSEFSKFLETTKHIIESVLNRADNHNQLGITTLKNLSEKVFSALADEDVTRAIDDALESESGKEAAYLEMLTLETRFFNERYANFSPATTIVIETESTESEGLENAKTVKESFEELIKKLPVWAKKVLKVLNELLSIVKTLV